MSVLVGKRQSLDFEFQSSPGPRAGSNSCHAVTECLSGLFQSSPGPRAGSNDGDKETRVRLKGVSILSRPASREQCGSKSSRNAPLIRFNPLPAREPGAICPLAASARCDACFNPLPAREPGAMEPKLIIAPMTEDGVSILSRPASREQ